MRYLRYISSLLLLCLLVGCAGQKSPFLLWQRPTATPNPDVQQALEQLSIYGQAFRQKGLLVQIGVFTSPIDMQQVGELSAKGPLMVGIYAQEDNEGNVYFSRVQQPGDKFTFIIVTAFNKDTQEVLIDHPRKKGFLPARILEGMPYLATWDPQGKGP